MSEKGYTNGQLDKLHRRVLYLREKSVPRNVWSDAEIMYEAYYMNNGGCPSSAPLGQFQVTEKRKKEDIPNGTPNDNQV